MTTQSSPFFIMPGLRGVTQSKVSKLQRAQNYAARIVTGNFDYVIFSVALIYYMRSM